MQLENIFICFSCQERKTDITNGAYLTTSSVSCEKWI